MQPDKAFNFIISEFKTKVQGSWALGVCVFIVTTVSICLLSLANGFEDIIRQKVLSSIPNQIQVEPSFFAASTPGENEQGLSQKTLCELKEIPGVTKVYRLARLNQPARVRAKYLDQVFYSDIIVEGADQGLIEPLLKRGENFGDLPLTSDNIPAVLPGVMVDILMHGISIHTDLPGLSSNMLIGRHFTVSLGASSFSKNSAGETVLHCKIVGILNNVGLGGPTMPLSILEKYAPDKITIHSAVLELENPEFLESTEKAVQKMGLSAPKMVLAQKVSTGLIWLKAVLAAFCLSLLFMQGAAIFTGLSLEIRRDSRKIAIFRSLGAKRKDILLLYLSICCLLGLLGTILGSFSGIILCFAGNYIMEINGVINQESGLTVFKPNGAIFFGLIILGTFTSILAGLKPSLKAVTGDPVKLMAGDE